MFGYTAYGLDIRSTLELPELIPADGLTTADVLIRRERLDDVPPLEDSPSGGQLHVAPDAIYLRYDEVGTYCIRGGREILVDPLPGVEERVLRLFILGAGLGLTLRQRGYLVLHASAVAVERQVVAILGGSGWGKSTTARALHARGHGVVADDVVAVQLRGDERPSVWPGFPQLKLWPEAAAALGDDLDALPHLHPRLGKRARQVPEGFTVEPLPLRGLYVLAEGESQAVVELAPHETVIELVTHSYGARALQKYGAARHLAQCAHLASLVPVRRLQRPRALPELPALAQLIEADLAPSPRRAARP